MKVIERLDENQTLTVKGLIEMLQKLPGDALVFTSIDPEGNAIQCFGRVEFGAADNVVIIYPQ